MVLELFADDNSDGVPDDLNADGEIDSGDSLEFDITDDDGLYLFDYLNPGKYIVGIASSNFEVGGVLEGMSSSELTISADTDVDGDDNGYLHNSGYVLSDSICLDANTEPLSENPDSEGTIDDSSSNLTVDFGFFPTPVYDLALLKELAVEPSGGVFNVGDEVSYVLSVLNQGDADVTQVSLVDYVPEGLVLADNDWTEADPGVAILNTPIASIPAGMMVDVEITFAIAEGASGVITNTAEVAEFLSASGGLVEDIDSLPDDDIANDGEVVDGVVDGTDGDEDDSDIAVITVGGATDAIAFTGSSSYWFGVLGLIVLSAGLLLKRGNRDAAIRRAG